MTDSSVVSIVTVNFNEAAITRELLSRIRPDGQTEKEIIVVDNSTDASERLPASDEYKLLLTPNNGYAAALNAGIKAASGEWILLTNNDILPERDIIDCLVDQLKKLPDYGGLSPVIVTSGTSETEFAGFTPINAFTGRNRVLRESKTAAVSETPYLHGACMLVRRSILSKTGLLPEIYFLYYEEIEWSKQIIRAGFRLGVANSCRLGHRKSFTISKTGNKAYYYLNRNRILFQRRNTTNFQQLVFFAYLLCISLPVNLIRNILMGNSDLNRELLRALAWNLRNDSMSDENI